MPNPAAGVFQLLYVSDIAPHVAKRLPTVVEDILIASTRNNARDAISGFLVCDGARFAQMLEGSREAVEACFAAITADDRHTHISVRSTGLVEARQYSRWSMCAWTLSAQEDALLNAAHIELDLRGAARGALAQHLLGISQRHADELDALHAEILRRG